MTSATQQTDELFHGISPATRSRLRSIALIVAGGILMGATISSYLMTFDWEVTFDCGGHAAAGNISKF
jgi:hypothetical protein